MINGPCWLPVLLLVHATTGQYHDLSKETFTIPSLNNDSYFGYSMTYQANRRILVVSAPKADDIGKVYVISVNDKIPKEAVTPKFLLDGYEETKNFNVSNFLLGATVKAGEGFFVMCAPRYIKIDNCRQDFNRSKCVDDHELTRIMTFGLCFKVPTNGKISNMPTNLADATKVPISNLERKMTSYGWSLVVTTTGSVLVGSPFSQKGQVQFYRDTTTSIKKPFTLTTPDMSPYNFGYSTAYGDYFNLGRSGQTYFALSSTYGTLGEGKVSFFESDTSKNVDEYSLDGIQLGSMFGATLCTAYLGGPKDSLLVGAPIYVEDSQSYDRGAVYVYVPDVSTNSLKNLKVIKGMSDGGYFGRAIVNLGDMDGDLKDEIAIGAPYENDGRGSVYIYYGAGLLDPSQQGDQMLMQKIQPAEGLRSFGFSLTALRDYDDNGCNELGIGAPDSNSAVVYKCFAYVTLNLKVTFPKTIVQVEEKDESFKFQSCVNVVYGAKPEQIEAKIGIKVEITHPNIKLVVEKDKHVRTLTYEENLQRNKTSYCRDIEVFKPKIGNYGQPLFYNVSAYLLDDPQKLEEFNGTRVLLSKISTLSTQGQESLAKCLRGPGNCAPDLKISYKPTIDDFYTIGSTLNGSFSFVITNKGDPAYTACLLVQVQGCRLLLKPPGCTYENGENLVCTSNVGLPKGETWNTGDIVLDTSSLTSKDKQISIIYTLYNHCNERNENKISRKAIIDLLSDTDNISINPTSDPDNAVNIFSKNSLVRHIYTIINDGLTNWVGVTIGLKVTKKDNVKFNKKIVEVLAEKQPSCEIAAETEDHLNVNCSAIDLKTGSQIKVIIPFDISPIEGSKTAEAKNITSELLLHLEEDNTIISSVLTTLQYTKLTTPLWIIILACVIGIIIVVLIAFALYECGLLRRKKRAELKSLRQSVHRQSLHRQSMRHSRRRNSQEQINLIPEDLPLHGEVNTNTDPQHPHHQEQEVS